MSNYPMTKEEEEHLSNSALSECECLSGINRPCLCHAAKLTPIQKREEECIALSEVVQKDQKRKGLNNE